MEYLTADQPTAPQYFPHTAAKNWVSKENNKNDLRSIEELIQHHL